MTPASVNTSSLQVRAERAIDQLFCGSVPGGIYDLLRIGIAATFLVRHSDWLRPVLDLEHHRFVHGLLFLGSTSNEPRLHSPLWLGCSLSPAQNDALVYTRTGLGLLLLLGIRTRLSAGLLAVVSYVLLAEDRYRYYHHLFLLYVAVAVLALTPNLTRLSLERWLRNHKAPDQQPLWPLQVVRSLVLSVYLAAALSKLDSQWLRGAAIGALHRLGILGGPGFEWFSGWFGYAGVGIASCALELALPVLLVMPKTRRLGVCVACAFHTAISLSMPVYSFGVQMLCLVSAFWPRTQRSLVAGAG